MDMIDKIIEAADSEGWHVSIDKESLDVDNHVIFTFSKYSPAGQDFEFSAEMEDNEFSTLLDGIYSYYLDFDCSQETYLWLDETGHGKNGAPYEMIDVYNDMMACEQMVYELWNTLADLEITEEEDAG